MGPTLPQAILVVDDDSSVRAIIKTFLERSGYRVAEAACGEEALRVLAQQPCAISLLLVDVIMPGMTGPQLVEQVWRVKPDLPVLFMSGNAGDFKESLKAHRYLQKPFNPKELLGEVSRMLPARKAGISGDATMSY